MTGYISASPIPCSQGGEVTIGYFEFGQTQSITLSVTWYSGSDVSGGFSMVVHPWSHAGKFIVPDGATSGLVVDQTGDAEDAPITVAA